MTKEHSDVSRRREVKKKTSWSVNDLRIMTGFPLAKMTRALTTLVACNCISRDGEGCYRLNDDFAFFPNK